MVSCTCSLWLEISSRALNLWSRKYSKKQETGKPKSGKESLLSFCSQVPLTLTLLCGNATRDAGVSAARLRLGYGSASGTATSHSRRLAGAGSWSWASAGLCWQPSCLCASAGLAQHPHSHRLCPWGRVPCPSSASADPQGSTSTTGGHTAQHKIGSLFFTVDIPSPIFIS